MAIAGRQQLQQGVSATVVAQQLPAPYLVKATATRVLAYRRYRESVGEYWTVEQLERLHWEALYGEVSLEWHLGLKSERISRSRRARYELDVRLVRVTLCTQLDIPEEAMLPERISAFHREHETFALLPFLTFLMRAVA